MNDVTVTMRKMRSFCWMMAAICGLGGVYPQPVSAADPDVTGLRLGRHEAETRLVLDMTDTPAFRIESNDAVHFTIELPPLASKTLPEPSGPRGLIGTISGRHDSAASRIELTTGQTARINRAFYLPGSDSQGPRLVLDFAAISQVDAKTLGQQVYGSRARTAPSIAKPANVPIAPAPGMAALPPARPTINTQPAAGPNMAAVPLPRAKPPALAAAMRPPAAESLAPGSLAPGSMAPPAGTPARLPIIVIDAGHGGVDPGATAITGLHEKDLTLAVARELRRQLLLTGRYRVVLTRDRDHLIPLRGRVQRAQEARGDLFISLHADTIGRGQVHGLSIYTLSDTASDTETAALAKRENRDTVINGVTLSDERADVANILIDLAMRDSVNQSNRLANTLLKSVRAEKIRLLEQRPHRAAGFVVLKAVNMPSVLVEMGYLSNSDEATKLAEPAYQASLARGILNGIDGYFNRRNTQIANR